MTLLDLVGPMQIWNNFQNVHCEFVSQEMSPVTTDTGFKVLPTHTFSSAEQVPDILFVPGGTSGTTRAALDPETVGYVKEAAMQARWITSVCTGALVLGAAGLLRGYRAATHWAAMPLLENFGATPVYERYVIDRNRATGGGVTAGIDFGLVMMSEIAGEESARAAQLAVEYAPRPPFRSGTPKEAKPETLDLVQGLFSASNEAMTKLEILSV